MDASLSILTSKTGGIADLVGSSLQCRAMNFTQSIMPLFEKGLIKVEKGLSNFLSGWRSCNSQLLLRSSESELVRNLREYQRNLPDQ